MKIKSVVFVNALKAAFEQLGVAVATSTGASTSTITTVGKLKFDVATVNRLLLEAEQGNFILFARFFDNLHLADGYGASDGALLSFVKALTDDAAVAETALLTFTKVLAEVGVSTDDEVIAFVKGVNDAAFASEDHRVFSAKGVSERVEIAEGSAFGFSKKARDDITFVGDAEYLLGVGKALVDAPAALDDSAFTLSRPFDDAFAATESHAFGVDKVFFDQVTKTDDDFALFSQKASSDLLGAADTYASIFNKASSDTTFTTDDDIVQFGKATFDTGYADDGAYNFGTTKQLESSVFFTDDVDGAASIEDDQEMQFVKITSHVATVAESLYRQVAFFRDHADVASSSDARASLFEKSAGVDIFSATDALFTQVGYARHFSDTPLLSDTIGTFSVGKGLSDTPKVSESLHRQVNYIRLHTHLASAQDAAAKTFARPWTDEGSVADDFSRQLVYARALADSPLTSDQINTVDFGKTDSDVSFALDAVDNIDLGKGLSDAAAAADEINTVSTTKQLASFIFATDDVDGTASILDDQETQFTKLRTDVTVLTDVIYVQKGYLREFFDFGFAADAETVSLGKQITDVPRTSDTINMLTGKHIYDIPTTSEAVAKSFGFAWANSALPGDANIVAFGKKPQDLASTTDTGSLRSQGYADFTYFAEDYVGASRAF